MKTRFAPSPTGYMHLGNVRTALFSYLLAKSQQGDFLLRIEDTDASRSSMELADYLQVDLHWLGLIWQEGPGVEGKNGPYFQSQRHAIYDQYYKALEEKGVAYPCFCSDQELAVMRKVQLSSGQPPRYAGTCRNLTAEQIAEKKAQGKKPTLRFRVPDNQAIKFVDFVRGPHDFATNEIGDFIVRRADGSSAFFFCNAIDDSLMGVTHVLRGEDHLTNTPRQLMILQALGLKSPEYGHVAMIVGPDGSPLSKRHGSRSLKELREMGYLPTALQNYMTRLGHYLPDNDFMTVAQLAEKFSVSALGKSPARFDQAQLLYWQKQAVQQLDPEAIWQWLGTEIQALIPATAKNSFIAMVKANVSFPEEALEWAKILFANQIELNDEAKEFLQTVDTAFWAAAITAVKEQGANFKAVSEIIQQKLNVKGKALFHPLRLALTGRTDGPEMARVFELLGVENIQQRLGNIEK